MPYTRYFACKLNLELDDERFIVITKTLNMVNLQMFAIELKKASTPEIRQISEFGLPGLISSLCAIKSGKSILKIICACHKDIYILNCVPENQSFELVQTINHINEIRQLHSIEGMRFVAIDNVDEISLFSQYMEDVSYSFTHRFKPHIQPVFSRVFGGGFLIAVNSYGSLAIYKINQQGGFDLIETSGINSAPLSLASSDAHAIISTMSSNFKKISVENKDGQRKFYEAMRANSCVVSGKTGRHKVKMSSV